MLLFIFSQEILEFIMIKEENVYHASYMIKWLIPGCILQAFNFQMQAYILAQSIYWPLGAANFLTVMIVICTSHWMMNDLQVGILIFPICKMIAEVMN